jgi:glycosyltransferase involved in cell wall biosynthesis
VASPGGAGEPENPELVSCIIIFLDEERFLAEAVASVVAQSYRHWELILVDDGSADASTAIARRFTEERPDRIRYVDHPGHANLGMSASRNLGLAYARGTFVAFLDADDVWLPSKLEEQVAIMRAHPDVGMVCGATVLWESWAGGAGDATPGPRAASRPVDDRVMEVGTPYDRPLKPSALRDVVVAPPTLASLLYPLGKGFSPSSSNFLLRRSVVMRVGGYEAAFRAMYEDQAFQVKMYLDTPIYVSTAVWDRYRQHPRSCSATARRDGRVWQDRGRFLEWLGGYLDRTRIADPTVRRAFARAVWPFEHPLLFRLRRLAERASLAGRILGRSR